MRIVSAADVFSTKAQNCMTVTDWRKQPVEQNMSEHEQVSPVMHRLSAYMASALKRKLPTEVAERAKLSLIDTFAAMVSGSRLIAGKRVIAYVKPLGGTREAGVIGTRIVTTTLNAALANGMCCHADESDDTHPATCSHPGTSVIPAALTRGEIEEKALDLMAPVLGKQRSQTLMTALYNIDGLRNVRTLRKLYTI